MSKYELNKKATRYFEILSEIASLEDELESIKDVFKSVMVENSNEIIDGDGWRATWNNTKTNRIDSKKLKEDLPEVYKNYCKLVTGTRFTLNHIKS